MIGDCMKCKRKREMESLTKVKMKNNRPATKANALSAIRKCSRLGVNNKEYNAKLSKYCYPDQK